MTAIGPGIGPGSSANELKKFMQQCALKGAKACAERHRNLVNEAVTNENNEDRQVRLILEAGDSLDKAIRSCLMHGMKREDIAEELSEWLSPTYVRDLLDNPF